MVLFDPDGNSYECRRVAGYRNANRTARAWTERYTLNIGDSCRRVNECFDRNRPPALPPKFLFDNGLQLLARQPMRERACWQWNATSPIASEGSSRCRPARGAACRHVTLLKSALNAVGEPRVAASPEILVRLSARSAIYFKEGHGRPEATGERLEESGVPSAFGLPPPVHYLQPT